MLSSHSKRMEVVSLVGTQGGLVSDYSGEHVVLRDNYDECCTSMRPS